MVVVCTFVRGWSIQSGPPKIAGLSIEATIRKAKAAPEIASQFYFAGTCSSVLLKATRRHCYRPGSWSRTLGPTFFGSGGSLKIWVGAKSTG